MCVGVLNDFGHSDTISDTIGHVIDIVNLCRFTKLTVKLTGGLALGLARLSVDNYKY